MMRWIRWHCPPDVGFKIWTLTVWGRARYLSVTESHHNIEHLRVRGGKYVSDTWMPSKHKTLNIIYAGLMLAHRLWRLTDIKPELVQHLVFAGKTEWSEPRTPARQTVSLTSTQRPAPNVRLMLARRLRRRSDINQTLGRYLVFAGVFGHWDWDCKAKRHLLTCEISRYCLLPLHVVQDQKAVSAYFLSGRYCLLALQIIRLSEVAWPRSVMYCDPPVVLSVGWTCLSCKAKRQYLLTLQVSRYCLLALQSRCLILILIYSPANSYIVLVRHRVDAQPTTARR